MRVSATVLFCLLLLSLTPAVADDKPAPPPKPLTEEQAADAVLAAVKAKDDAALKALAEKDNPDPWLVADLLCYRGEHDAAEAFAKAAPRVDTEKLPGYVASRRGKEPEEDARKALAAINAALQQKQWPQVAELAGGVSGPMDSVVRVQFAYGRGLALGQVRKRRVSTKVLVEVGEAAARMGWLSRASAAFYQGGVSAYYDSRFAAAASAWNARLTVCREIGDKAGIAQTLNNIGIVQKSLGNYPEALASYDESLEIVREIGDKAGIAATLNNIGIVQKSLGNYPEALSSYDQSLEITREIGNNAGIAQTLNNIGIVQESLGNYPEALASYDQSLKIMREIGDKAGIAATLTNIGNVQQCLGNYPEALSSYDQSLKITREIGNNAGIAQTLNNIGNVQRSLGNYPEALRYYDQSLKIEREIGNNAGIAATLNNIGIVQQSLGNYPEALASYDESLKITREIGNKAGIPATLNNIGIVQLSLGNYPEALASYDESLEIMREIGDKTGIPATLHNISIVQQGLGNYPEALEAYAQAQRLLEETPNPATQASVSWGLARLHLRQDRPAKAVGFARPGVALVLGLAEGLAEGEGAGARDVFSGLFDVGTRASLRAGQMNDLLWFLEQGRAGSLREGLGSRAALEGAVLPAKLRTALNEVRTNERQALAAYRKADRGGKHEAVRQARAAWEEAQARVERVMARIQREAKGAASVVLAKTDELDVIRGHVLAGEALVLYGLTDEEGLALVIEPDGARMVTLEASQRLSDKAAQFLHLGQRPGARGLVLEPTEARVDAAQVAATLRKLLVAPLGLGDHVTRVLISPTGQLGYVPFSMLLPDREVAYTPSGTTHGLLLLERDKHGTKILGVGNPDYRTVVNKTSVAVHRGSAVLGGLSSLPGTLKEVEGIGGVSLLGKAATESGVRSAIEKQERWRSVHFACHGLLNVERPMLSALAITADSEDDGFLTCLDIFRMKIPADLVVMSACETGKGKIYKTEGIVGLTRAFMFAGAPRVICSLWKVDDEATQALMIKFYELWNPKEGKGLGAAEALKQAQAFIKGHDKWKRPYYWAAWVLWGLPD